ncbi:MAG: hypothetical protein JNN15_17825 [Blastocatellia bacterium]|nr:hypothetical protein [Blastocatellia bacterium]
MEFTDKQRRQLFDYILGKLSEEEKEGIENSYFEDDNFFEQLLIAEDELIDAYIENSLSRKDKELFEKNFLITEKRKKKLAFAKTLFETIRDSKAVTNKGIKLPLWQQFNAIFNIFHYRQVIWISAATILASSILWFVLTNNSNKSNESRFEITKKQEETKQPLPPVKVENGTQIESGTKKSKDPLRVSNKVSLYLELSFRVRGERGEKKNQSIRIGKDVRLVDIYIPFGISGVYTINIRNLETDKVIWSEKREGLNSQKARKYLHVEIPAMLLVEGSYFLELTSLPEDIDSDSQYYFEVLR